MRKFFQSSIKANINQTKYIFFIINLFKAQRILRNFIHHYFTTMKYTALKRQSQQQYFQQKPPIRSQRIPLPYKPTYQAQNSKQGNKVYSDPEQEQFQRLNQQRERKLQQEWQLYKKKTFERLENNQASQVERLQFEWEVKHEQTVRKLNDEKFVQIQTLKKNFRSQIALMEDQLFRMESAMKQKKTIFEKERQELISENKKSLQEIQKELQRQKIQSSKQKEQEYAQIIKDLEAKLQEALKKDKYQKKPSHIKDDKLYDVLLASGISDITVQILKSEEIRTLQELKELREDDLRNLGIKLGEIIRIRKI